VCLCTEIALSPPPPPASPTPPISLSLTATGARGKKVWDFCGDPCHRQDSEQNTLVLRLHDRVMTEVSKCLFYDLREIYHSTISLLPWLSPVLSPWLFTEPREGDNQRRTISLQRRHVAQCPQLDPWLALASASAPLLLARCARCSCGPAGDCESAGRRAY
jgi:hypothetical protein